MTRESSYKTACRITRICTPGLPGSGISSSAFGTEDSGGTRKPGLIPPTKPASKDKDAIAHPGRLLRCQSGKSASNLSPSSPSSSRSEPPRLLANGRSKLWPLNK